MKDNHGIHDADSRTGDIDLQQIAKKPAKKNRLSTWLLHILVAVLVVLGAWYYIDFKELIAALSKPDALSLFLLLFVATADRFVMAAKWHHLLSVAGARLSYFVVLRAYYEAAFVARVTPIAMGSEVLRAYTVAKAVGQWRLVLGSMVVEKAIAVVSTAFLATIGSLIIFDTLAANKLALIPPTLGLVSITSALVFILSMSPKFGRLIIKITPYAKIKTAVSKLHDTYALYAQFTGQLIINWFLAIVENSLQILTLFLSANAIGVEFDSLSLLGILTMSQFLRKMALVLEGWMLAEASVVVICAILGIDQSQALAFSLLAGATIIVSTIPGLILLLSPSGRSKRQALKQQETTPASDNLT
jgi:uncharacterized protein (TIRG00374 family)